MRPTGATPGWHESAWHYLTRGHVTWRDALQGSAFLATSAVAAATVVASARSVRRTRRRPHR